MIENGMLAGAQAQYERERFGEDLHPVMRAALGHFALPRGRYPAHPEPISDTVMVPCRGIDWHCKFERFDADEGAWGSVPLRVEITQVCLGNQWLDVCGTLDADLIHDLQAALDAMPSNS